ncbi:hypothetical protein LZC95_37240 [Pendulispora brunnea]|uniref:Uncharacterized protein n=1 Tax=Pendulispora brunnea TaxID=2905690 RepID=A0ABZ2K027_9BACT
MAGIRFPLLFPLLLAVSAGLGALTPSFSIEPIPPASQEPPNLEKSDPPPADDGVTAPV